MIRAIVTDIEGTTSSIRFVYEVLFPYAKAHLGDFVRQRAGDSEVVKQIEATRQLAQEPDAGQDRVIEILEEWIDQDRKETPLKALQGMLWAKGYRDGDFTGHVYPDAFEMLSRWHAKGITLYVFSSGSMKAQQWLFSRSDMGDLTPLFEDYFDTTIGSKKEAGSYRCIVEATRLTASQVLFLSDVVEELDAAKAAGLSTLQLVREPGMTTGEHPVATNFEEIDLESF